MASKHGKVTSVTLKGECVHGLQLVSCEECRNKALQRVRAKASQRSFAERMADSQEDLDALIKEAIPFVAANAVLYSDDRGFWLQDVLDEVMSVRNMRQFTRAMFGSHSAYLQVQAEKHVMERIRYAIKVRDARTNVRVYVSWRMAGYKPWRWGALHHLGPVQLRGVARGLGILGEGVAHSKDAAMLLVDLMEAHRVTAVRDVWDEALPTLEEWKRAG